MTQLNLFLISIGIGAGLRVVYFLCALLAKSTKLKAMGFVMDAVFACLGFAAFLPFVVFFADGQIQAFMVVGLIAGLFFGSIPFALLKRKPKKPGKETAENALTEKK